MNAGTKSETVSADELVEALSLSDDATILELDRETSKANNERAEAEQLFVSDDEDEGIILNEF